MANTPLTVVRSKSALQDAIANARYRRQHTGFVPTMGALHNGHLSLIDLARKNSDFVIASIFVNPTQFAPGEDFETYPRDEDRDLELLEQAGCNLAYLPTVEDMYPTGSLTEIRVPGPSDLLDGIYRPHFFYGVTTVVARLFIHVQPDVAVFGEKDYQQLQIIRRMTRDLGFETKIIGGATMREPDGLAQSSRNRYLSSEQRKIAAELYAALTRTAERLQAGAPLSATLETASATLLKAGFDKVDYISAVDPGTLEALPEENSIWPAEARLLGAAWIGKTRLIDNIPLPLR
ncbi:MAG: pantoate--beta-alanine ligase [Hyphomonadaceae bacterium]|nr:pantoate--beta-alanine ligase [Hyphomonadaceae bacterium]